MLFEEQISERQARAKAAIAEVTSSPRGWAYGDYEVKSTSGKAYRVAMRGPGLFENYCSCPDFAVNTLGTCKHIEALLMELRKRHGRRLASKRFERQRASLSLVYGDTLAVRLRLPANPSKDLTDLAAKYFDSRHQLKPDCYERFEEVMEGLRRVDESAVVYSDVMDFIEREREVAEGLRFEAATLRKIEQGANPLGDLLKVPLLPYQARGVLFSACRGRVVLADDMGLGKTVQAIAAVELLRRRRGIQSALVVAPASVKYQWKTEIEKFSGLSVQVVDGTMAARALLYQSPAFFKLTSYELVLKDFDLIRQLHPDVIILDEAQRIRNWTTATARVVKQLKSRYAIVLTGTPLENKLEELYSVVEFVDGRRLGPAFRFLKEHRMEDDKGKLVGYRGLDQINRQLQPILIRRTRQQVLKDLPKRTDQVFHVPMTEQQAGPYAEQSEILARILRKWERQKWLSEIDLRRLSCCIQNMRMLCNSTFLFDKETHVSPKLEEFREIIHELAEEENRKVVVFSEYERMTWLVGEQLRKMSIGFVSLHGGVPGPKRGALMEQFRNDAGCKVFLSTDAGGVGLNLQAASAVISIEPPWNPARLEQRIARVHRLGQTRPVQVIHFLTEGSIEMRVWETIRFKKALFAGLFEGTASEISFEKLGRKKMMDQVKELFGEEKPPIPAAPPPPPSAREAPPAPAPAAAPPAPREDVLAAASGLLTAGLRLIESLAAGSGPGAAAQGTDALRQAVASVVREDPASGRPMLAIPLPEGFDSNRLVESAGNLLSGLARMFGQRGGA